jgi:hypothetical protein
LQKQLESPKPLAEEAVAFEMEAMLQTLSKLKPQLKRSTFHSRPVLYRFEPP